jgi:CRP/FNR family transcriptional regulator, nitrogen fixation regulation protein
MRLATNAIPTTGRPRLADAPGEATSSLIAEFDLMAARMKFARNAEIFGEGEPADYLYKVVSGAVRTSKLLSDGRRQIGAFLLPGDFFGMEASDEHRFSAEAISDTVALVVKRSAVEALAAHNCRIARALWTMAACDLERAQEHMLALGRKNAQERLVTFLLDMARRGKAEDRIELPMSRQDIADYLGLTIETVSRTLTQLESNAAIEIPTSRCIMLRNRHALKHLSA